MIDRRKRRNMLSFAKYLPAQREMNVKIRKIMRYKRGKSTRNVRTIAYTRGEWMGILGAAKQFKKLIWLDT